MSKFVKIETQLRDLNMIKQALDDLRIDYSEDATYSHIFSGGRYRVPVLVRDGSLKFGFRLNDSGGYEAVGDEMQIYRIRPTVDRISQRYAYNMVLAETARAGFSLVEEKVGNDEVIHLTVRRWA